MPTLVEIKTTILDFEKNQDLQFWNYEGMDLWPILRSLVYVECRNEIHFSETGVQLDWKKGKEKSKLRSILQKFRSHFLDQKSEDRAKLSFISDREERDVLLFGSWYFRTHYEGMFINKFYYPLITFLNQDLKIRALEVEYSTHPTYLADYQRLKGEIDFVADYPKVGLDQQRIEYLLDSKLFDAFFTALEGKGVDRKLRIQIANKVEKIYTDSFVYQAIFQKYNPKFAFCLTFFSEAMFAMIFAASKAGITTIDLGHGFPSDKENMIYSKLTNVPIDGYNTLPDIYWVWDVPVKVALEQWCLRQRKHQVVVGGNPWLEYCSSKIPLQKLSDKNIVLYTLTVSLPEVFVLDAMKKTEGQYEWWIRLHPSIRGAQSELKSIFNKSSITNFNLSEANTLDLPFLLKNVDVHISRNSSSIYESVFLGNTPVILDQEGMEYFDFYLESGQALGLPQKSPEKLIQMIQTVLDRNTETEIIDFKYKTAVNFLFKNKKAQKSYLKV